MDTMTAAQIARLADVSLPTAHALIDQQGVPRTGRGVSRTVPTEVASRVLQKHPRGFRRTEIRILAALARSPLGLNSARRVAEVSGLSPTTTASALVGLIDRGLVRRDERQSIRAGRVVAEGCYSLNARSPEWPDVRSAVLATESPERSTLAAKRVPQRFWHLFWNSTPARLQVSVDGSYIARRLLNSSSLTAAQWALTHIEPRDLESAVAGRGADARTKAMVHNWLRRFADL